METYNTVYKWSLSVTPPLPAVDDNPNNDYSFVFDVNFQHIVELLNHTDGAATEIVLSDIHPDPPHTEIPRHQFFSGAPTVVRDILSSVNVPRHIADFFAPRITSLVWHLVTRSPSFSAARKLPLSLNVTAVATLHFFVDGGDGEEEVIIDHTMKESTEGDCSICLEEVSLEKIVQLPCSHIYHKDCITRWLETSHTCPNCRRVMPPSVC